MEPDNNQKTALIYQGTYTKAPLSDKILADKVHLLYEQNPYGILAQCFSAFFLVIALWRVVSVELLLGWFIYLFLISCCWFAVAIAYKTNKIALQTKTWLILFAIFTFLSGCGWGFASSILMPTTSLVHQSFVIILIFGMTAGSISYFSPVIAVYALFLFPAFIPFTIWLFSQGGIYILLGFCGLVYMPIIFISCYYSNKFITNFLSLYYKNLNLDSLNQLLERRVRKRTHDLEKSLAITKSTLESTTDGILVIDLKGHIEYYNQKFIDMWGLLHQFIMNPDFLLFAEEMLPQLKNAHEFLMKLDELKANPEEESYFELISNTDNIFEWHSKPHKLRHTTVGYVWIFRDITLRKQMEKQLAYQATHDLLTGLPNRTLLYDRINQGIAYAKRYNTQLAVLFLDIDNFKLINDNLGHDSGDILLQKVARRLRQSVRQSDTIARFGGDEFVILFISNKEGEVFHFSQKLLKNITQPIQLLTHRIIVNASVGVSVYPQHGKDAATLLKNADMAMYQAKKSPNNFKIFDKKITEQNQKSLEMQIELRNALIKNEFFLLYQPTIDLKSGEIIGVEALVRWQHPTKGIIHPLTFIPMAEESRLIIPLGKSIFLNACLQNKTWQNMGLKPIRMAINVSGVQLAQGNFVRLVKYVLRETKLDPDCLEIELTESIVMDDRKQNLHKLKQLKEIGVHLTIDDFGTGYSSLNYLREFPVDKLKIDQCFLHNSAHHLNDASLLQAIIAMGHSLKLRVLAEGIETFEQLQFLRENNCDEGQGFFYDYPMKANEFAHLLSKNERYQFKR
ncbi:MULTISPECIES: bifunctional diguanylate cyclase/phosphodiesterase [unclassified Legionella]|uniref:putative bifunctional diguanylate cyclase/phosphodiesterase n=1 Tax=unclassified Legionella TaxID=2622702 RepID=UPI001F5F7809|nr:MULTISPECIES: EAL domain-containing protein [unclassified Legionella]MDI9818910.1 EAL domain-containing protein [Legionella sp. PL877]